MKRIYALLLLTVVAITATAELPQEFGRFKKAAKIHNKTPEQDLISRIAIDGAFIIYQNYQLEDSLGKFFGRSGNRKFGAESALAFKVKKGYLIYDTTRAPWNHNPHFSQIKNRNIQILSPTQYSELKKEAMHDSINYNAKELRTIYPEQIYGMKSDMFFNDGFYVAHHLGQTDGYLIWYILPPGMDLNTSTKLDIIAMSATIDISDDRSKEYSISVPQTDGTILGGVFLAPELSSVGCINLIMNGVIIGDAEEWRLVCPFSGTEEIFDDPSPVTFKTEDMDTEFTQNVIKK